MARKILAFVILLFSFGTFADELSGQPGEFDAGIHVMVNGYKTFPGIGAALNYAFDDNWTVGGMLVFMRSNLAETSGGSLDTGEYYAQYLDQRMMGLEANLTYFPRTDGVRRSGALIRFGLGESYRRTTAHWTRYDRDPGWLVFGDDKRERESGQGADENGFRLYSRVGAGYQLALGKQSIANGHGHILEFGLNAVIPFGRQAASFTKKTTGEAVTIRSPFWEPMLDISYRLIF